MVTFQRPPSKQPIPDQARSVFKGKIFEVFQWEQPQFDGTTALFEKVKRPDTVSILPVTANKKILLTKQYQPSIPKPFFSPVGGIVDPGEEPYGAALRELTEETGYVSDDVSLWYSFQSSYKIDWALYMFVAKNCVKSTDQNLDPGEKIEVVEADFDEFFEIAVTDNFRDKELSLRLLQEYRNDSQMTETKKVLGLTK